MASSIARPSRRSRNSAGRLRSTIPASTAETPRFSCGQRRRAPSPRRLGARLMTRTGAIRAVGRNMNRCPISKLTRAQAHLLASVSLPGHDPHSYRMWNGIYRSLRIRGLVDRNLRLTDDGRAALTQCKFFSPPFTASLTYQSSEGVAPRHHHMAAARPLSPADSSAASNPRRSKTSVRLRGKGGRLTH